MIEKVSHFGCYAVVIQGKKLLCISKSRGPYEGFWDLAGGSPEDSESYEDTLSRELREETGGTEINYGPWHKFSFVVEQNSKGRSIRFTYQGVWRQSRAVGIKENSRPVEDSDGLAWVEVSALGISKASSLICHVIPRIELLGIA